MTAILDRAPVPTTQRRGDTAIEIVDAHRRQFDDHSRVEALGREFPTYARQFGEHSIFLFRAEDNLAGAFKWRGAVVAAEALKRAGNADISLVSAGNHLRGGILAAHALGLNLNGIVPTTAPPAKSEGARQLWADLSNSEESQLHFRLDAVGNTFDESLSHVLHHPELGALLHPFDNPDVIAGQGTIIDDILVSTPDVQRIVVPVGGGGLLAGVRQRLDELGHQHVVVHGVEASGSSSMSRSLAAGELVAADHPNQRFGGSAVRVVGKVGLDICLESSGGITLSTVTDAEVDHLTELYEQDRRDLLRRDTPAYEPTTLVAIAGLARIARKYPDDQIVVVGTGHNAPLWPTQTLRPTMRI